MLLGIVYPRFWEEMCVCCAHRIFQYCARFRPFLFSVLCAYVQGPIVLFVSMSFPLAICPLLSVSQMVRCFRFVFRSASFMSCQYFSCSSILYPICGAYVFSIWIFSHLILILSAIYVIWWGSSLFLWYFWIDSRGILRRRRPFLLYSYRLVHLFFGPNLSTCSIVCFRSMCLLRCGFLACAQCRFLYFKSCEEFVHSFCVSKVIVVKRCNV